MNHRVRRQLTAWLGLIAMCLVAFAPTASHFARAAHTVTVAVCTIDGEQTIHLAPDMGGQADHGARPMDDCGYCDLLHHAPAMPMVPPAPVAALFLLFTIFVLPALTRFTPLGAFASGRPRGPPAVS